MINKVFLLGRLTRDPELKYTPQGTAVTNASMATNRYWRNSQGERQEETEFHNLVIWGNRAETFEQYAYKGMLIHIDEK